jgi:LysM repeat protein
MGRVRLTRRGRVAALVLCLLLSGGVAAAAASASQAGGAGDPRVAVVEPGDTLWSVAARHVPSRDPYGAIAEIRRLNDLGDTTIHPGQELILPAR